MKNKLAHAAIHLGSRYWQRKYITITLSSVCCIHTKALYTRTHEKTQAPSFCTCTYWSQPLILRITFIDQSWGIYVSVFPISFGCSQTMKHIRDLASCILCLGISIFSHLRHDHERLALSSDRPDMTSPEGTSVRDNYIFIEDNRQIRQGIRPRWLHILLGPTGVHCVSRRY